MRIPLLRGGASLLSGLVARAPVGSPVRVLLGPARSRLRGEISAASVLQIVGVLESAGIACRLAGGWGIDALVGKQTRSHDDLDLVIDDFEHLVNAACGALAPFGYRLLEARRLSLWMPDRWKLRNEQLCRLDLLSIDWHRLAKGLGIAAGPGEARSELLESVAFTLGTVEGNPVPCLSATVQLLYHTGFELRAVHRHDVALVRPLVESLDPPHSSES